MCGGPRDCVRPLLLVAVVGTLAYNFQVVLALFARYTFHGGAGIYSALTSLMGGGAVVGGLLIATRNRPNIHRLTAIGHGVRRLDPGRGLITESGHRPRPHLPHGGGVDRLHRHRQRHLAAAGRSLHAGPGHGSLRHRLPGDHAHRCPLVGWISQAASPRVALAVGRIGHRRGVGHHATAPSAPAHAGARRRHRRPGAPGEVEEARGPSSAWPDRQLTGDSGSPAIRQAGFGSLGRPRTRSPTMLRWISAVPPQMVSDRLRRRTMPGALTDRVVRLPPATEGRRRRRPPPPVRT
jgi:hypothetical protein